MLLFQKRNKFVSTSVLSRGDKAFVKDLVIKLKTPSVHGNSKATCWKYVGQLFHAVTNVLIDEDRLYCSVCLDEQKSMADGGHISTVGNFSTTTSTANMNLHLSTKHNINDSSDVQTKKVVDYFQKYDRDASTSSHTQCATSDHEFSRDMVLWFCRDLIPFNYTDKPGMAAFFGKNLPMFSLPSPATLSSAALNDVYLATVTKVKELLADVKSLCIMFDGWTDRHRARPYLGLRVSFVKHWSYHIVTLSCEVLPSHTADAVANHALKVLKQFVPHIKKVMLTSCHDGAANMRKASQLLKVNHYQHCTAHALHLLLTVDSIHQIDDVAQVLQKCREIVTALHFKSCLLDEEISAQQDKIVIETLKERVANANKVIELDDQFPLSDEEDNTEDHGDGTAEITERAHHHVTLKAACPTRWNSALLMIESVLDLKEVVQSALKRLGHWDRCLSEIEWNLLTELCHFLKPFKTFTDIVSCSNPTLSLVPVMKMKIRKMCVSNHNDDPAIKKLKEKLLEHVDERFRESDATRVHQLLDPGTKDLIPRHEGTPLLEKAITTAVAKQLIKQQEV